MLDQPSRHQCWVYSGAPSKQLHAIGVILAERLNAGFRCMYLNSPAMVSEMCSYLSSIGVNVEEEVASGALQISSDQNEAKEGQFEIDSMITMLKSATHQSLADGFVGLWASGDMTWEFGDQSNLKKLLEYECKLEQLFQQIPALQGICQYHMDTLPNSIIQDALCVHRSVFVNATLSRLNPYYISPEILLEHRPESSDYKLQEMLEHLQQNHK